MNIELKFDTEKPIYSHESEKLEKINKHLLMGYNGWNSVVKMIDDIPLLKEMYDETMNEMLRDGNCGMSACLCSVIRKAFYDLRTYKKEEEETDLQLLEQENYNLKRRIECLEQKLSNINAILK